MAELDAKTAHYKDSATETSKATSKLSNDWQDIANTVGPALIEAIDGIAGGLDWVVTELKALGQNKDWNTFLSGAFGILQNQITTLVAGARELIAAIQWLQNNGGKDVGAGRPPAGHGTPHIPAASGFSGMVNQPTVFLAGESGSEHVEITPHGAARSSGGVYIDLRGAFVPDGPAVDRLANLIAQRLSFTTGR
jgi:hypothetical protein